MQEYTHCAGIDWSMTCPAITIFKASKEFSFDSCKTYFLTNIKKYVGKFYKGRIQGVAIDSYDNDIQRFDNLSNFFISKIPKNCLVAIEGYSMGSKGKVFNIAENTGILKYKLWQDKVPYLIPAPTEIKKFATGNGRADKNKMYEVFSEETNIDLRKELDYNKKNIDNPLGDIIDSYYICKYVYEKNF